MKCSSAGSKILKLDLVAASSRLHAVVVPATILPNDVWRNSIPADPRNPAAISECRLCPDRRLRVEHLHPSEVTWNAASPGFELSPCQP